MEAAAGFAHLEKKGENKKESKTLDVEKNDGDAGLVREKKVPSINSNLNSQLKGD